MRPGQRTLQEFSTETIHKAASISAAVRFHAGHACQRLQSSISTAGAWMQMFCVVIISTAALPTLTAMHVRSTALATAQATAMQRRVAPQLRLR